MLIIDDDDDVVAGAGRMGAAWHITVARDLTAASCLIRRQRFDVVLIDIAMTGETLERGIAFVAFARTLLPEAHKPLQICLAPSLANF